MERRRCQAVYPGTPTSRAVKRASERGHAPQARQGGYHGERPAPERIAEESWRSLKSRVEEVGPRTPSEKLESPLSGSDLMEQFGLGPGRWIKALKDYLQNEVVEGRLGKDDKERARWLAETYAREHDILEE